MSKYPILTVDELAIGRENALSNARELVQEAKVLLDHTFFARAIFLSSIAGEEIGKYLLLSGSIYMLIAGKLHWKSFWKSFRSHAHKLKSIMITEILLSPPTGADEKRKDMAEMKQVARALERGKQLSLYVDHVEGAFRIPSENFTEEMAQDAIRWAEGRIAMTCRIEEVYAYKAPEAWTKDDVNKIKSAIEEIRQGPEDKECPPV